MGWSHSPLPLPLWSSITTSAPKAPPQRSGYTYRHIGERTNTHKKKSHRYTHAGKGVLMCDSAKKGRMTFFSAPDKKKKKHTRKHQRPNRRTEQVLVSLCSTASQSLLLGVTGQHHQTCSVNNTANLHAYKDTNVIPTNYTITSVESD